MKVSRRRARTPGLALVLLVLLAVAGCGAGETDETEEPGVSAGGAVEQTAPGSTLGRGESARLPFNDGRAVMELTVTGVEQGTSAQLRAIDFAQADQRTPYYVRLEATLVAGDSGSSYAPTLDLMASAAGTVVPNLAFGGDFPPCELDGFQGRTAPGTTITTCLPFLVPRGGAAVDEVFFSDNGDYRTAEDGQVTWSGLSATP